MTSCLVFWALRRAIIVATPHARAPGIIDETLLAHDLEPAAIVKAHGALRVVLRRVLDVAESAKLAGELVPGHLDQTGLMEELFRAQNLLSGLVRQGPHEQRPSLFVGPVARVLASFFAHVVDEEGLAHQAQSLGVVDAHGVDHVVFGREGDVGKASVSAFGAGGHFAVDGC